jgi:biopolymer transport protein ExbD
MAFATASGSQMVDMNVTPLVDVMLVLLIIFMVTVPALEYPIQLDLSRGESRPQAIPLEPLRVHIGAGDTVSIDGQLVTLEQLQSRFAVAAAQGISGRQLDPSRQPEVRLSIEADANYGLVTQVMSRAKNAKLVRIGFAD